MEWTGATTIRKVTNSSWIIHPIGQVGLCTPFYSIKWAPTTNWVCTPQLLVSTKSLHTPSDVLMLNVLLEWVCNPFCRKWVYHHVCSPRWSLQNGLYYKTNSQSTSKSSIIKWHWVLRGGSIYKKGSTKWGGPTPPTLKTRWISFFFAHDPTHFVEETGVGILLVKSLKIIGTVQEMTYQFNLATAPNHQGPLACCRLCSWLVVGSGPVMWAKQASHGKIDYFGEKNELSR